MPREVGVDFVLRHINDLSLADTHPPQASKHDELNAATQQRASWNTLPEEIKLMILECRMPATMRVTPTSHGFLFRMYLRSLSMTSKQMRRLSFLVYTSRVPPLKTINMRMHNVYNFRFCYPCPPFNDSVTRLEILLPFQPWKGVFSKSPKQVQREHDTPKWSHWSRPEAFPQNNVPVEIRKCYEDRYPFPNAQSVKVVFKNDKTGWNLLQPYEHMREQWKGCEVWYRTDTAKVSDILVCGQLFSIRKS